ncbi:hypothetical protein P8452_75471 [Trifolium repens]|jgi:ionotropic glutamate receptor|nr:hypothetical protein P8452_75471 [Trifolium repens]
MATNTVAIIGLQTSTTAHVISHIANELQVPLLSFSATDPTIFAYDTVYVLARSLDTFFKQGNRITFSRDPKISEISGDSLHL